MIRVCSGCAQGAQGAAPFRVQTRALLSALHQVYAHILVHSGHDPFTRSTVPHRAAAELSEISPLLIAAAALTGGSSESSEYFCTPGSACFERWWLDSFCCTLNMRTLPTPCTPQHSISRVKSRHTQSRLTLQQYWIKS